MPPRPPPKQPPPAPRPKKKIAPQKARAPPPPASGVVVAIHGARVFFERDDGEEAFAPREDVDFRVAVGDRVQFSVIDYKDFEGKRLMAVDVAPVELEPEPEPEPSSSHWWVPSLWNRRRRRAAATEGLNPTAAEFRVYPAAESSAIAESDLNAAAATWAPLPDDELLPACSDDTSLDPAVARLLTDLGLQHIGPTLAKEEVDRESLCLLGVADLIDAGVGVDDAPVIVRAVGGHAPFL